MIGGETARQEDRLAETIARYEQKNPEFVPILESKFREFKEFDREIKSICGKSAYEILGI
jgi:hypothetical protein